MALTYTELTALVRNWSNKDEEVVSDAVIQDTLQYAADKAYRTLRVPPLENVAVFTDTDDALTNATLAATNINPSKTELQIPQDLVEIISIKETDSAGNTIRVFNEKLDNRTFFDPFSERYTNNNYFTRERNIIYLSPGFGYSNLGTAANIEVYYYRRLPALNSKFAVTVLNYAAGLLTTTGGTTALYFVNGNTTTAYATQAEATAAAGGNQGNTNTTNYIGLDVPHWLRDQNERILIYGALAQIFAFTQDDVQAAKYDKLFYGEIKELNSEDKQRQTSGGNVQMNFNGRGML
mgnify:CR=1 FL=1|tara:strand:+ start:428 stop:1306 length:879 start_codon:yes stop_codon:yes gene_type:complete